MADDFGFIPDEEELGFISDDTQPNVTSIKKTPPPTPNDVSLGEQIKSDIPYIDVTKSAPVRPMESMLEGELSPKDVTKGQSFVSGAAKSTTMGFAPEIVGYVKSKVQSRPFGVTTKDFIKREKDIIKLAEEGNPKMFTAGELSGAMPHMLLIPGGGSPASQSKNIGTLMKMIKASKGFITPTIEGMITAAGYSDAEDFKGRLKDAGFGGLFGIATHGAGKAIGKYAMPKVKQKFLDLGKKFKKKAELKTLDAMGLYGKKRNKIMMSTKGTEQLVKDSAMARQILDDKNIKLLGSTRGTYKRAIKEANEQGKLIGDFYAKLDDLGATSMKPSEISEKVSEEVNKAFRRKKMDSAKLNAMKRAMFDLSEIPVDADGKASFQEIQMFKRDMDDRIKKWTGALPQYEGYKKARGELRKILIDESIKAGAPKDKLVRLNLKFKNLANVDSLAELIENKQLAKAANDNIQLNPWSLNYMAANAAITAATKGANILNKFRKGRYASTMAVMNDFISKRIDNLANSPKINNVLKTAMASQNKGDMSIIHALLWAKSKPYRDEFKEYIKEQGFGEEGFEETNNPLPYDSIK